MIKQFILLLTYVLTVTTALAQTDGDKNDTDRRYSYFYLEAISNKLNDDYGAAFNLLNHCIAMCPERPEAYYDRGTLYNEVNEPALALADYKKAFSLNKSQKIYKRSLFYQYLMAADYTMAAQLGEELSQRSADMQLFSILLSIYSTQKDYDGMLRTLDRIEEINGTDENVTLAKMQIFERRGEKSRAYEEIKKLADSNPRNTSYKVMLGNWMLQNGRADEAYKVYMQVLEQDPEDIAANMSLLDYYREIGKESEADALIEKMLMSGTVPGDSKVLLMSQLLQNIEKETNDTTKALEMFDKVLASPGTNADIAEMKAAYMTVKKMPQDDIINALLYALGEDASRLSVRLQLLQEYWNKKDYASVIKYSSSTDEYTPDDISVYYFGGLAYLLTDDDDNSLSTLKAGIEYINNESNPLIVSDVYCIMGDIYHSKGMVEEAFAAYDSCLQYNDKNVGCLNNYAYYLSLEERDLDKAEKMSQQTIMQEPNNGTYLDTYAWILFLQGKYPEAKVYMEQLLRNSGNGEGPGPVIYDHLGDVYIMNGETDKAIEYWQKAKETGSTNKVLDEKIKTKKYIPEKKK